MFNIVYLLYLAQNKVQPDLPWGAIQMSTSSTRRRTLPITKEAMTTDQGRDNPT